MPHADNPGKDIDGTKIPMPRFIRPGFDKYSFNKCYNEHDGLKEDHADLQDLHKLLQHRIAFLRATKDLNSQSLHQEFVKVKVRLDGWIAELEELAWDPYDVKTCWLQGGVFKYSPNEYVPTAWNNPKPGKHCFGQTEDDAPYTCRGHGKYEYRESRRARR